MNRKLTGTVLLGLVLCALSPQLLWPGNTDAAEPEKRAMIIFDDGPTYRTAEILEVARERNLKIGFAVVGNADPNYYIPFESAPIKGSVAKHPDIIRKIVEEGHILINHTEHHAWFFGMSKEEIKEEILDCENRLRKLGYEVNYFRPPYFVTSDDFWEAVKELNEERTREGRPPLKVILGAGKDETAATKDVVGGAKVESVKKTIKDLIKNHDWNSGPLMLTFHAIPASPIDGEAFREILDWLEKEMRVRVVNLNPDEVAKLRSAQKRDVRSTESKDERGNFIAGVEAGPVIARMLTPFLVAQAWRQQRTAIDMDDLLPRSGPSGTKLVVLSVPQALITQENAIAARATEFRTEPDDLNTTKAVVMVIKTKIDKRAKYKAYQHDGGICPRFHWDTLDALGALRVSLTGAREPSRDSPWFWFYRMYNHRLETFEEACQFVALVNESRREITIDSRWIGQQYSPHWNNPQERYDYILNFQVWSYSAGETLKLARTVLSKLNQLGGSWKVMFANQQEPTQPTVFMEEAWYTGNSVHVSVWNCLPFPTMACFHGTKQYQLGGEDVFFEEWLPVYPGRNVLQLRLGQMHNAVIYCEVNGFMDKIFVSVDRMRPVPLPQNLQSVTLQQEVAGTSPKISISWPPSEAKVAVLRDQLDMPNLLDKGGLVAVNGTFSNAPTGSQIAVYVYTDKYYQQEQPVALHNDLWGTRVYLAGEGSFNKHWIYAMLYKDGKEIAKHEVGPVYRLESVPAAVPAMKQLPGAVPQMIAVPQKIIIEASKWKIEHGGYRWPDGCITIGGGPSGPHGGGGTAWCQVELPVDASSLKLRMSIWHGLPSQEGKGVHSRVAGGTVTVLLNDVQVDDIVCQHHGKYGDFWPEEGRPRLGRDLPEIDLQAKGITGKSLTIKLVASPWTCMDLRAFNVTPVLRSALPDRNMEAKPMLEGLE